jgi:D-3-phosphoglycerate dehydrogenase
MGRRHGGRGPHGRSGGRPMSLVVITDCDHPSIDIERAIFEGAGHSVRLEQCHTPEEVIAAGHGAAALLSQYAPITEAVIAALPQVRVLGRYGVGLDNIDGPAAERRGLRLVNVPDYGTEEVANHALALMLSLSRGIVALDRGVHAGSWDFRLGGELRRSSVSQVGIVGLGRIGQAMARRALALGYRVVATDPRRPHMDGVPLVDPDELFASSDVVSVHAWLDEKSRHLVDARKLALMKPGAILVNTARGPIVDKAALVDALRSGKLAGAALDVVEGEPIGPGDPLLDFPNVVLTPHAAFYSRESIVELKRRVAEGMVAALAEVASGASTPDRP